MSRGWGRGRGRERVLSRLHFQRGALGMAEIMT